jgi:hypothetical protein
MDNKEVDGLLQPIPEDVEAELDEVLDEEDIDLYLLARYSPILII